MDIVGELYRVGAIKFGRYTLKSGQESPVYLDLRVVPSKPQLFREIVEVAAETLGSLSADGVVGVATGGLVWSSTLAYRAGLPHFYVREEKKTHGTSSSVEGGDPSILKRPVIVDDVATSGSSIASAASALEAAGAKPTQALVIVDREQGAREKLAALNITLHSCFTLTEILEGLRGRVPGVELEVVLKWHTEQKTLAGRTGM